MLNTYLCNRIRRVKCDEHKPVCQRCSTGDFICRGYLIIAPATSVVLCRSLCPSPAPPQADPNHIELELSHFFRTEVVNKCSDEFSRDLWGVYYPQASQNELALWHGCNALAACFQARELQRAGKMMEPLVQGLYKECRRQYCASIKGIMHVANKPGQTAADKVAILGANLLFTVYWTYTQEYTNMEMLSANSIRLIQDWRLWEDVSPSAISSRRLLFYFLKLETMEQGYSLVSCKKPWHWNKALSFLQGLPFSSCADASLELELISMGLHAVFPTVADIQRDVDALCVANAARGTLRNNFEVWTERFDRFRRSVYTSEGDGDALCILEIRGILVGVMLEVDLTRLELSWDDFEGMFERALSLAERPPRHRDMPSFKPMLLKSLHWMAKICRKPTLRRKIIATLDTEFENQPAFVKMLPSRANPSYTAVIDAVVAVEEAAWSRIQDGQRPHDCGCSIEACVVGEYICNNHRITHIQRLGSQFTFQTVGDTVNGRPGLVMKIKHVQWG